MDYVYVPEFRINQDPDLAWAQDERWRRADDAAGLTDDPGSGYMVPMASWDQRVLLGQLRESP